MQIGQICDNIELSHLFKRDLGRTRTNPSLSWAYTRDFHRDRRPRRKGPRKEGMKELTDVPINMSTRNIQHPIDKNLISLLRFHHLFTLSRSNIESIVYCNQRSRVLSMRELANAQQAVCSLTCNNRP